MINDLPKHIAIIMDGNGRWARKRFMPRIAGHRAGYKAAQKIIRACAEQQIEYLTLFTFSSENWLRPKEEVSQIQNLMLRALTKDLHELVENNIKLTIIGDIEKFNPALHRAMLNGIEITCNNTGMNLIIAANYGGQWDILQACRQLMQRVINKEISMDEIDHSLFEKALTTGDVPAPELFIRTSGEQRISNFYIWQLAYTEMYFSNKYWPEFTEKDLHEAMQAYMDRERRFGLTSEQIKEQQS